MPEPGNPQALNRFAYVYGNPVNYADPTGHIGDPDRDYGNGKYNYYHLSSHPRYRANWSTEGGRWKWATDYSYREDLWLNDHGLQEAGKASVLGAYYVVRDTLDAYGLRQYIGMPTERWGALPLAGPFAAMYVGPDGTILIFGGLMLPGAGGWTASDVIFVGSGYSEPDQGDPKYQSLLNHEYCHVLQVRKDGPKVFYTLYSGDLVRTALINAQVETSGIGGIGGKTIWEVSHYEREVARPIEGIYDLHPELPGIWAFPRP